jgi:hypothetical protein
MGPSYLVVLFQATGGKSGEDLGSDEEQIVLFVYLLYDVTNNKVRFSLLSINSLLMFMMNDQSLRFISVDAFFRV